MKQNFKLQPYLAISMLFILILACENHVINPDAIKNYDLSGRNFSFTDIVGYDLSRKIMKGADFSGCYLSETKFIEANLQSANLSLTHLEATDFTRADLKGADLSNSLSLDKRYTNFTEADLRGANLNGMCIQNAKWDGALLDEKWTVVFYVFTEGIKPGQDLSGYDFSHVCFTQGNFTGVNFQKSNLLRAVFWGGYDDEKELFYHPNLYRANFTETNLINTNFTNADLRYADFSGAILTGADFSGANLENAIISIDQLYNVTLFCTRMPDGTLTNPQTDCKSLLPMQ